VTALSRWDDFVKKSEECLTASGVRSSRCKELTRMYERGVSETQVHETIGHVERALPVIRQAWVEAFGNLGRKFDAPQVFYYGISTPTPGVFTVRREPPPPACLRLYDNAFYCEKGYEIHYDAVLFARVANAVRAVTGSDGRYGAIAVVAHEMGHAADSLTGASAAHLRPNETADQGAERLADCFSGATIAAVSRSTGSPSQAAQILQSAGPLAEGQLSMYFAGGAVSDGVHGAGKDRIQYFTDGFNRGIATCAPVTFPSTTRK
jgi:predicted metalloprotease